MYQLILEDNFEEQISSIVLEASRKIIPHDLKLFLSKKSNRKKLLDRHGEKSFLQPDKLKFPVVDQNGNPHKGLIKAAYMRAKQFGHGDVASKAKDMMQEYGEEQIPVTVEGHEEIYDVAQLFDILELEFSAVNAALVDDQDYKTVFRGPDQEILVKAGDKVKWTNTVGEEFCGLVKSVDSNVAIVDVDGVEKTLEL
jgi:hypothetical protein